MMFFPFKNGPCFRNSTFVFFLGGGLGNLPMKIYITCYGFHPMFTNSTALFGGTLWSHGALLSWIIYQRPAGWRESWLVGFER